MTNERVKAASWQYKTLLLLFSQTKLPWWELWDSAPSATVPGRSLANLCRQTHLVMAMEPVEEQPFLPWLEKKNWSYNLERYSRTREKFLKSILLVGGFSVSLEEKKNEDMVQ